MKSQTCQVLYSNLMLQSGLCNLADSRDLKCHRGMYKMHIRLGRARVSHIAVAWKKFGKNPSDRNLRKNVDEMHRLGPSKKD